MDRHFDEQVARLAARQHGVISMAQVRRLGGTDEHVRVRIAAGRWIRLARGAYQIAGLPRSFATDLMAATLLTGGSAVSDRPAAALQQLTGFGPCRPELTTTVGRGVGNPLAVVHRRATYRSTRVDGIRVGTIDQVVGDLAGTVALDRLGRAIDDAILDRRLTVGHLEDLAVVRTRGRLRGAGDLRSLVRERSSGEPVPESFLEDPLRRLVCSPGIPPAEFQMPVPWIAPGAGRVDAAIVRWQLIVEADGRRWHTRIDDFDDDRSRDRAGLIVGWPTIRFTYVDLTSRFDDSLAELRAVGASREAQLGLRGAG